MKMMKEGRLSHADRHDAVHNRHRHGGAGQPTRRADRGRWRGALGAGAVALVLLAAVAACGGSNAATGTPAASSGTPTKNKGPVVVMSTFTPTVVGDIPNIAKTRTAIVAAATQTATAGGDPQATQPPPVNVTATATVASNEVRPPAAQLVTSSGSAPGSIGAFNFYSPALDTGADIQAPYVTLPDGSLTWTNGAPLRISITDSPYAVQSATVRIFAFEGNIAIPTDPSGKVIGQNYAFYPQTDPRAQLTLQGPELSFTPTTLPAGRHIVSVDVQWLVPDQFPQLKGALRTQYVFLLEVV